MPRIQLIVTGKTEKMALGAALQAAFPTTRDGEAVEWAPALMVDEPTKARLRQLDPSQPIPNGLMVKLAQTMLGTLKESPQPGRSPPELVLAIGDVELHNLDQEALIVAHLRAALEQEAVSHPAAALLPDRCSYHLLRPMVEASFFGDAATLKRAGVSEASQEPKISSRDVEEFESTDPQWTTECARQNARHALTAPWWRHERHAAKYLDHLVLRTSGRTYQKTRAGVDALRAVPWADVVHEEPSPYLRALFDDLARWFGVPSPLRAPRMPANPAPTHPDATPPSHRFLRNL